MPTGGDFEEPVDEVVRAARGLCHEAGEFRAERERRGLTTDPAVRPDQLTLF